MTTHENNDLEELGLAKLFLHRDATIRNIKFWMQTVDKIPICEQMLVYCGSELKHDHYPLWYYNIKDHNVIRMDYRTLLLRIQLLDMEEIGLKVCRTDTIDKIKVRVWHKMVERDGRNYCISIDALCLMQGDMNLEGNKMVKDYKISDGDKMEVLRVFAALFNAP